MGIKSTKYITRGVAESRISQIVYLTKSEDYSELKRICDNDEDWFKENYISEYKFKLNTIAECLKIFGKLSNWTNSNLEQVMDMPGFRFSMFDNYLIIE